MQPDDSTLTISRLIPAPPAVVWRAWSQAEHLAQWWIPKPIECQVVRLDLHPGGGFETRMRDGDGPFQPHLDACFLDIQPERRLVFTTALRAGWQPVEPWLALTAVITLEAVGTDTRYAAQVMHRSAEDSRKHADLGFEQGWGSVLDQLAAYVPQIS